MLYCLCLSIFNSVNIIVGLNFCMGRRINEKKINILKFHCFRFCHNDTKQARNSGNQVQTVCFENSPNCKPPNFHFPGGYAIITMRARYVKQDDDLSTLRTCIQQLVDEEKVEVVEDRVFERFL